MHGRVLEHAAAAALNANTIISEILEFNSERIWIKAAIKDSAPLSSADLLSRGTTTQCARQCR